MASRTIAKSNRARKYRPGAGARKARRVVVFVTLAILGSAAAAGILIAMEIGTPGMAWYVYR